MVDALENDAVVTTTDGIATVELTAIETSVTVVGDPIDVTVDGVKELVATDDITLDLTNEEALPTAVVEEDKG